MVASYAYYTQVQRQLLITEKQLGALLYEPQSSTSIPMHQIHKETFEETNYVDYTYMTPEKMQTKLQQFVLNKMNKYLSMLYCICWQ